MRIANLRFAVAPRKVRSPCWLFLDAPSEFMLMNEMHAGVNKTRHPSSKPFTDYDESTIDNDGTAQCPPCIHAAPPLLRAKRLGHQIKHREESRGWR
jgi:hypothetical protein